MLNGNSMNFVSSWKRYGGFNHITSKELESLIEMHERKKHVSTGKRYH